MTRFYPTSSEKQKKPYHNPQLLVYGDLAQITRSTANITNSDGSSTGNMKTH